MTQFKVFYNNEEYDFEGNNVGHVAHKFFKWAIGHGIMKNRPKYKDYNWEGVEIIPRSLTKSTPVEAEV